jgi:cadmium resistance protein CadD (predicted permease)
MTTLVSTSLIATSLFVATNIDDLILLGVLFAAAPKSSTQNRFYGPVSAIVLGQFLGIGLLVGASLFAGSVSLIIPADYIRLLGILPLVLGLYQLWPQSNTDNNSTSLPVKISTTAVAFITIANGGDNIGVYSPLFATQTPEEIVLTVGIFALMTGLWLIIAHWISTHPYTGAVIKRYASRFLPFVLIGLGFFILLDV